MEDRILFHKWSKEIYIFSSDIATSENILFLLTTSEIKFDLPSKSTNILFILCFLKICIKTKSKGKKENTTNVYTITC